VVVAVPTVNGENHDAGDPARAVGELRPTTKPSKAIRTLWIAPLLRWSVKDDDEDGGGGGGV
jgi:hypothetical protein